ncbi:hypothetical protein [Micromonospora sp. NPDC126480]|uniref:hypothetical protein n=1 Tax=Micromonospora sp. NPDC126480 TaxID=3155312 RepID=UPI00331BE79E
MRLTVRGRIGPMLAALAAIAATSLAGCGGEPASTPVAPGPTGIDLPSEAPTAGGEPAASPVALPDACQLVTKPEAEELAGTPLNDAVPIRDTCGYTAPVSGPTAQVEVYVGDGAKKYLDIERELGHELRPLAGVADEAYAGADAVFVHRSGVWVAVRLVRLNDPAENRKPLEKVARTVAERL